MVRTIAPKPPRINTYKWLKAEEADIESKRNKSGFAGDRLQREQAMGTPAKPTQSQKRMQDEATKKTRGYAKGGLVKGKKYI